jgi:hypothetical protein
VGQSSKAAPCCIISLPVWQAAGELRSRVAPRPNKNQGGIIRGGLTFSLDLYQIASGFESQPQFMSWPYFSLLCSRTRCTVTTPCASKSLGTDVSLGWQYLHIHAARDEIVEPLSDFTMCCSPFATCSCVREVNCRGL